MEKLNGTFASVRKVREFLALARNTTTIPKAAQQAGVSLSVITSLGQLGRSLFRLETPTRLDNYRTFRSG